MKVTRFGHAAVLVESAEVRILIDPGTFSAPAAFDLTHLDAVVVTHQHPDHFDVARGQRLVANNPEALWRCDPQSAAQLGGPWQSHTAGDVTTIGQVSITAAGEQHAEILSALPPVDNVGVVISDGSTLFFHPGDSYATIPDNIDLLALPLSAPWAKISETVDFVRAVAPGELFAIHDATLSEVGHGLYWNHVVNHGGAERCTALPARGSLEITHN